MSSTARRMQMAASNVGGGEITQFTYVADAVGGADQSITMPSSAQAGDIAIAYTSGVGGSVANTLNGFTSIATISSTFDDILQYRIVQSGDAGSTFTNSNATSYDVSCVFVIRPNTAAATVTVSDINNSGLTTSAPADQTIGDSDLTSPRFFVVVGAQYGQTNHVVTGLANPVYTTGSISFDNSIARIAMYIHLQNGTPFYDIVSMVDYGSYNRLISCVITAEP
jgi:hypothetical protein